MSDRDASQKVGVITAGCPEHCLPSVLSMAAWRHDMASHRVGAGARVAQTTTQPAQNSVPERRWIRRAVELCVLVGAFVVGVLVGGANHSWHDGWSTLVSKLVHLADPIQLGITIFLAAVAAAVAV